MKIFLKQPIYVPDLKGGDRLVIDRGIYEAILNGEYVQILGSGLSVHKSIVVMSKILPIPNELKILDNLCHRLTPAGWEAYRAETSLLHPGEFYWDEKRQRTKYRISKSETKHL